MDSQQTLLTKFEKQEIESVDRVYYYNSSITNNNGESFDDSESFYKILPDDHIAYRFQIVKALGKGSFGQVVSVYDHKNHNHIAMKIIRSQDRFTRQAKEEVLILNHLMKSAASKLENIPLVMMYEQFSFRGHTCITFELLGENLFELIKSKGFVGLQRIYVKRIANNILKALRHVHSLNIIHCDLKPENILIVPNSSLDLFSKNSDHDVHQPENSPYSVKLIDFGSSAYIDRQMYPYIQSRFYRAPEIILRSRYTTKIDMWSFGCLLVELIRGLPLFSGSDEFDQMAAIMEIQGIPPKKLLNEGKNSKEYFKEVPTHVHVVNQATKEPVKFQPYYVKIQDDPIHGKILASNWNKRSGQPRAIPGAVKMRNALKLKKNIIYEGNRMMSQPFDEMKNTTLDKKSIKKSMLEQDTDYLIDLIEKCLNWLPEERISANSALDHIWLHSGGYYFQDLSAKKSSSESIYAAMAVDKRSSRNLNAILRKKHSELSRSTDKEISKSHSIYVSPQIKPQIIRNYPREEKALSGLTEFIPSNQKVAYSEKVKRKVKLRNSRPKEYLSGALSNTFFTNKAKPTRHSYDVSNSIPLTNITVKSSQVNSPKRRQSRPFNMVIGQKSYQQSSSHDSEGDPMQEKFFS